MDKKQFNLWNSLAAWGVFVVALVTYTLTLEPTASFWDCGEFIASSYKLEVGHPPGNPVFQLIARFFSMFTGAENAAVAINWMSGLCSAFTIFFLYLTIVFLAKRLFKPAEDGSWSKGNAIAIIGSGVVGALAYTFSDTFWFSAVEAEVYAMSSLFTALVFWVMTKWYEDADKPHADRWIVLVFFLMGLSIGVHLLNLLALPALVFLYAYRKREQLEYTFWQLLGILAASFVVLGFLVFLFIPYLPKVAAGVDLFFVNSLGLPFNSGAAVFMVLLLAASFLLLFRTQKTGRYWLNLITLCFTTLVIGFSIFSVVIIRSSVKTPTNEYQPDNPYTLVRYLSREQYGSTPLVYGQYYDAPYDLKMSKYWAPMNGKYVRADAPAEPDYLPEGKMLFPRMWAGQDERYIQFYESYTQGKGTRVRGADHRKPSMGANLLYFFDYQLNWMYWRYFFWNFVGRQNDIHSPSPGNIFDGNWESGIGFLDRIRLDDQGDAPDILLDNKGKNHYFFLPLLLGLLGLLFQFDRDKRGTWIVFLMFFMTGIAIVLYLNQPPYQVRERDYAYAGSFYMFSVWIGFAVAAIYSWITEASEKVNRKAVAIATSVLCLGVPALMAEENWDDHDRSHRYTAVEMAKNYLNSVGENGILITHGDNDTFPLWYAQEVEGIRTDVRIVNTSLLGTDWHIDQMKYACNKSAPLPLTIPQSQYLYGTNEYIFITYDNGQPMPISQAMDIFKDPKRRVDLSSGRKADFLCARKLVIPVNRENALRSGIVPEKFADMIPDSITLEISENKSYISKPELFLLDLLSNYQWDRPLHLLNMGGDLNVGIKDYLMYDGFSYRFVPFKNKISATDPGLVDSGELYRKMTEVYSWDALKRTDYFVDYQNYYTFLGVLSQRALYVNVVRALIRDGENEKALEMLDACQENVPEENFPLETIPVGFSSNDYMVIQMVSQYYQLGAVEKARDLAVRLGNDLMVSARFFLEFYDVARSDFEYCGQYIYVLTDEMRKYGDKALGDEIEGHFNDLMHAALGDYPEAEEAADSLATE